MPEYPHADSDLQLREYLLSQNPRLAERIRTVEAMWATTNSLKHRQDLEAQHSALIATLYGRTDTKRANGNHDPWQVSIPVPGKRQRLEDEEERNVHRQ